MNVDGWEIEEAAATPDLGRIAASGVRAGRSRKLLMLSADGRVLAEATADMRPQSFAWLPDGQNLLLAYTKPADLPPGPTYYAVVRGADLSVQRTLDLAPGRRLVGRISIDPSGDYATFGSRPSTLESEPARLVRCHLRDLGCVTWAPLDQRLAESDPVPVRDGQFVVLVTKPDKPGTEGASWLVRRGPKPAGAKALTDTSGLVAHFATLSPQTIYSGFRPRGRFDSVSYSKVDAESGEARPCPGLDRIRPTSISAAGDSLLTVTANGAIEVIRPE